MFRRDLRFAVLATMLVMALRPSAAIGEEVRSVKDAAAYDALRARAQAPTPQRTKYWNQEFYLCATPALAELTGSEIVFAFMPRDSIRTAKLYVEFGGPHGGIHAHFPIRYTSYTKDKPSDDRMAFFAELKQFTQDYQKWLEQYPTELRLRAANKDELRPLLLKAHDAYAPIVKEYKNAIFFVATQEPPIVEDLNTPISSVLTNDLRLTTGEYSIGDHIFPPNTAADSCFHVAAYLPAQQLFVKSNDPPGYNMGRDDAEEQAGWLTNPLRAIILRAPSIDEAEALIAATEINPGQVEYLFQFDSFCYRPGNTFYGGGPGGPLSGLRLLGYRVRIMSGNQEKVYTFVCPGK